MQIVEINKKKEFDSFAEKQANSQFLQSWEWGEFQKKIGCRVIRLGVKEKSELLGVASIIIRSLPILNKHYFYCPRGPILISDSRFLFDRQAGQISDYLLAEIAKIAEQEQAIFLRFEPHQCPAAPQPYRLIRTIDIQPSRTSIIDIARPPEEVLKAMHQKTRYNIRLSGKKGLKIIEARSESEFERFWPIMLETKNRNQFRLHSKSYYLAMINSDSVKLYLAEYQNQPVAGIIVAIYGKSAVYLHGASSDNFRHLMAPYALQWHAIKAAQAKGCEHYDLNGIDEKKWPGVTRFKAGFGGKEKIFPGTYDAVFKGLSYNIYCLLRNIRRKF